MFRCTSILGGPRADVRLAEEHRATGRLIVDGGLSHTFLRNGWCTENCTQQVPVQPEHGVLGSAGDGRAGAAPRADYAGAAAVVLTTEDHDDTAHELSGDQPFTLAEYAAELARHSGRPVAYHDLPAGQFLQALVKAGVPVPTPRSSSTSASTPSVRHCSPAAAGTSHACSAGPRSRSPTPSRLP
ncbi:quinone oxidoreductase [Streptomyces sp. F-3]|uniref:hypothetical protein n=1 Tax=Streptomyces sp. F-3 TaxID=1840095 RepID=UPI0007C2AF6E|nr:hypothetical protein [Streptomyces sp. F-3]GAT84987.1 quinone oxidoreductase [Streptomyces sp. F-3]